MFVVVEEEGVKTVFVKVSPTVKLRSSNPSRV